MQDIQSDKLGKRKERERRYIERVRGRERERDNVSNFNGTDRETETNNLEVKERELMKPQDK